MADLKATLLVLLFIVIGVGGGRFGDEGMGSNRIHHCRSPTASGPAGCRLRNTPPPKKGKEFERSGLIIFGFAPPAGFPAPRGWGDGGVNFHGLSGHLAPSEGNLGGSLISLTDQGRHRGGGTDASCR